MNYHQYAHLKSIVVEEGQWVRRGQLIGYVGGTGGDWTPHLHYAIRRGKPKRWSEYTNGMTLREVAALYVDPLGYFGDNFPVPWIPSREGWSYLQWNGKEYHPGRDLNFGEGAYGDDGAPCYATCDGQVEFAGNHRGFGNHVWWREEKPVVDVPLSPADDRNYKASDIHTDSEKKDYLSVLKYREQGFMNTCVATQICQAATWDYYEKTGKVKEFSVGNLHLRAHDLWPKETRGIPVSYGLKVAEQGLILESHVPYGDPWVGDDDSKMAEWRRRTGLAPNAKKYPFKFAEVKHWSWNEMSRTILIVAPVLAVVELYDGWGNGVPKTSQKAANHLTLLIDVKDNDHYVALDSLRYSGDDDGIRIIHKSNVKEAWIVSRFSSPPEELDERYGQPYDKKEELRASAQIWEALHRLKRQDLIDVYLSDLKLWNNAVAYGGYNAYYTKWGRWFAGDIINQMHAILTDQTPPFDLTKSRDRQ